MSCRHCGNSAWANPDEQQKEGFMWCGLYHGWMSENGFCNQDTSMKRSVPASDVLASLREAA